MGRDDPAQVVLFGIERTLEYNRKRQGLAGRRATGRFGWPTSKADAEGMGALEGMQIVFSRHAIERMLARGVAPAAVRSVVDAGDIVQEYPDDTPLPSVLLVGSVGGRALHVLLGYDSEAKKGIVITVYEPDPALWEDDWKTRRRR